MVKDEAFANACVTSLIEKVKGTERFPTGIASEVYAYTEPGDRLRELIVRLHVQIGEGTCIEAPHEDAEGPVQFLADVRRRLRKAKLTNWEYKKEWKDACRFHRHLNTESCRK